MRDGGACGQKYIIMEGACGGAGGARAGRRARRQKKEQKKEKRLAAVQEVHGQAIGQGKPEERNRTLSLRHVQ